MKTPGRVRLCGIDVDCVTQSELNAAVEKAIAAGESRIIANHNLHSVYLSQNDTTMREFYSKAHLVHAEGMGVVVLARLLGLSLGRRHRIAYLDWIWHLMERAAERGWRVFYLGSRPGVAEKAANIFRLRYPGVDIRTADGYFDAACESPSNRERIRLICDFQPQLLFVGMGMPRQERWIVENQAALPPTVMFNVGACADYVAGEIPMPPRWLGSLCMEWLYRLCSEPRRLSHRYLVEPWYVARAALTEFRSRQA
jgi:N-acetylglucosaminyldiphosphoundecaprenol N-acetyl-beta-D-mannosaminyltransferase